MPEEEHELHWLASPPESSLLGELYECKRAAGPAGRAYPSRSNLGRFDTRSSGL
jgi:hypothetical protein